MISTSRKSVCLSSKPFVRKISMNQIFETNHYNSLGVTPSATQDDIKKAYYKLSKIHHPDLNKNSEESTKKFRQITAAYEILGNEKSRKQYDLDEMHPSQRPVNANVYRMDEKGGYDDESERIFYERTRRRKTVYTGRSQHYNYDAWYKGHYGHKGTAQSAQQTYGGFREEDLWVRRRKVFTNDNEDNAYRTHWVNSYKFFGMLTMIVLSFVISGQVVQYHEHDRKSWKKTYEEHQKRVNSRTEK